MNMHPSSHPRPPSPPHPALPLLSAALPLSTLPPNPLISLKQLSSMVRIVIFGDADAVDCILHGSVVAGAA